MFSYIEPPNERIKIITNLLKIMCICTVIMGIFRLPSQKFDVSSILYFVCSFLYIISWRSLSYYYCLINQIVNLSIILNLLTEMASLLQSGLYQTYLSSVGLFKMFCLIFSIVSIYFNFFSYKYFKSLALQIYQYEHKSQKSSQ